MKKKKVDSAVELMAKSHVMQMNEEVILELKTTFIYNVFSVFDIRILFKHKIDDEPSKANGNVKSSKSR